MSITKMSINGNEYTFVNHSRSNRSGFVHETELYKNNALMGTNKIQYYNRTWECYQFQSVMRGLICSLLEEVRNDFVNTWKAEHNIKRLTKEKRKEMMQDFEGAYPKNYAELWELYSAL